MLFGANGAGKTNILEAVSLLSPGRGIRRARMDEIARRFDGGMAPAWGVAAQLNKDTDDVRIAVGQVPEHPRRRTVRIDGRNASGAELAQCVSMMWLTPAQDRLFTGPASDRRKFLDRLTLSHAPDHGGAVVRYEKSRAERGRLLSEGITDPAWYDAIERDMAETGAVIALNRCQTAGRLIEEIDARPEGVFPKAELSLDGEVEIKAMEDTDPNDLVDFLAEVFLENRTLDMRAGRTLRGVHKSDMKVTHRSKAMPAEDCSTGEQKALLIGLVLAQARAQAEHSPFLLLDEVAAHLDIDRRAALIEELIDLGTQVFLTGTDASLFDAFDGRADLFEVDNGAVRAA